MNQSLQTYLSETDKLFEEKKREVILLHKGELVLPVDWVQSFLHERQIGLVEVVKGLVPEEPVFETKKPIKPKDIKSTSLAAQYNRIVGFNLAREQFLKNLEL